MIPSTAMSNFAFDASKFKTPTQAATQYRRQLDRLLGEGKQIDCIETAVNGALANLSGSQRASFVIYGEPQSGKTEMMICFVSLAAPSWK